MPHFSVTAYDVPTGALVDTFKTLLSLVAADTVGHRACLRGLTVGGAAGAAQDIQAALRLVFSNNDTAGTGTTVTPTKKDPLSVAANLTSKKAYSVEPTTVDGTYVWEGSINGRGTLVKEWDHEDGPKVNRKTTLNLQGSPGITTAVTLNITLEFEEY